VLAVPGSRDGVVLEEQHLPQSQAAVLKWLCWKMLCGRMEMMGFPEVLHQSLILGQSLGTLEVQWASNKLSVSFYLAPYNPDRTGFSGSDMVCSLKLLKDGQYIWIFANRLRYPSVFVFI